MKVLLVLCFSANLAFAQLAPSSLRPAVPKPAAPAAPAVAPQPAPEIPLILFYKGTVKQVMGNNALVECGGNNRFQNPLNLPFGKVSGEFFVFDMPAGHFEDSTFAFYAIPEGTHTYTTVLGASRTIRAIRYHAPKEQYRRSPSPDFPAKPTPPPKTMLDQPARR